MAQKDKTGKSNIIKIGDKDLPVYVVAMVFKGQPMIYNEFNEIKIQVAKSRLPKANYLIKLFENWGLVEEKREQKEITITPENGQAYTLKDAYEITVRKIPALEG